MIKVESARYRASIIQEEERNMKLYLKMMSFFSLPVLLITYAAIVELIREILKRRARVMGRLFSLLTVALLIHGGLALAGQKGDEVVIPPNGPIVILTVIDQDWVGGEGGVELAREEMNSKINNDLDHPFSGHLVKIIHVGGGCEFGIPSEVVDRVIRRTKPIIVIGPSCSHTAFDISGPLSDLGILTISPSATDAFLTDPELRQPYFFRTAPNDKFEAITGAQFAREFLGADSAATIYLNPDPEIFPEIYHRMFLRLQEVFASSFSGTIVDQIPFDDKSFEDGFKVMGEDLDQLLEQAPDLDLIYAPLYHENVQFDEGGMIILYYELKAIDPLRKIAILSSEGLIHGKGIFYYYLLTQFEDSPFLPFEVYATGADFQGGPLYQDFLQAFIQYHGEEPGKYGSLAYDATNLALKALERVAQKDNNGNLIFSRKALLNAFNDPDNYRPPVKGAAAVYHAPVNGDLNRDGYAVYKAEDSGVNQVEDGDFLYIWSPERL
jgi:ABC-type branched-subunit amino acid transport system substrate-binding protein